MGVRKVHLPRRCAGTFVVFEMFSETTFSTPAKNCIEVINNIVFSMWYMKIEWGRIKDMRVTLQSLNIQYSMLQI